jgi:hypothetical protein
MADGPELDFRRPSDKGGRDKGHRERDGSNAGVAAGVALPLLVGTGLLEPRYFRPVRKIAARALTNREKSCRPCPDLAGVAFELRGLSRHLQFGAVSNRPSVD